MRIAELSRRAAVPIPTIKFYIREGMLPRGERTDRNQAEYTEGHVERLALIGTLQQAGLTLAAINAALRAMDGMIGDTPEFMALAVGTLTDVRDGALDQATLSRAEALLHSMVEVRGWSVEAGSPVWQAAVRACADVLSLWPGGISEPVLGRYAAVAEEMAAFELPDAWNPVASPSEALKYVVLGTVLFEPVILALRRLAHVDRGNKLRARRAHSASMQAGDVAPSSI
jgi:DNA-binding transcriptional MerR regulator